MFRLEGRGTVQTRTRTVGFLRRTTVGEVLAWAPGLERVAPPRVSPDAMPEDIDPPVFVGQSHQSGARWYWAFRGQIYSADDPLELGQVRILAIESEHRERQRLERRTMSPTE